LAKKLYVGNLPFSATEQEIRSLFEQHGTVTSVNVVTDRETGRARGFGFVEMDDPGAAAALDALEGAQLGGRTLRVSEAHERRSEGPRRGGGGGGRRRFDDE
jgi:RNA recognition motif-containing protein